MKHSHYFKPVQGLTHIDVYRVLSLFSVTDPCLQHAIKKLLVAGGRGGGKDVGRDVQEAIDTLERWKAMREEERVVDPPAREVGCFSIPIKCECGSGPCRGPLPGYYCRRGFPLQGTAADA